MALAEVEAMIKSCVLSKKGDMTLNELKGEYFQLVGEDIPFKRLGYESLELLLNKLSGISTKTNSRGQLIVVACSQKAAHIADLVNKQRTIPNKFRKVKGRVVSSPKKTMRPPGRTASRNSHSVNQTVQSKGNVSQPSRNHSTFNSIPKYSYGPPLDTKSTSKKSRDNRRRISYTQVRYTAAGEENSDDSYDEEFDYPSRLPARNGFDQSSASEKLIANGKQNGNLRTRQSVAVNSNSVNGHHRVVNMTGNILTCTVSVHPSEQSRDRVHSSVHPQQAIVDYCVGALGNGIEESESYSSWDNGPVIHGYHLVGDDFLLQFAYECLHVDCEWEDLERLSCGMCISGQTIHDFLMQVRHEGFIQPKIMLMLGAVDILQGNSLKRLIEDTTELLDDLMASPVKSLVFLTLPFLKNGGIANRKVLVFNEFLKTLDDGCRIHVLDAHSLFNRRDYMRERIYENCMNPKCYEGVTRDILCYPQGVVLWTHIGRSYLYNFLLQQLIELHNTKDYS